MIAKEVKPFVFCNPVKGIHAMRMSFKNVPFFSLPFPDLSQLLPYQRLQHSCSSLLSLSCPSDITVALKEQRLLEPEPPQGTGTRDRLSTVFGSQKYILIYLPICLLFTVFLMFCYWELGLKEHLWPEIFAPALPLTRFLLLLLFLFFLKEREKD